MKKAFVAIVTALLVLIASPASAFDPRPNSPRVRDDGECEVIAEYPYRGDDGYLHGFVDVICNHAQQRIFVNRYIYWEPTPLAGNWTQVSGSYTYRNCYGTSVCETPNKQNLFPSNQKRRYKTIGADPQYWTYSGSHRLLGTVYAVAWIDPPG